MSRVNSFGCLHIVKYFDCSIRDDYFNYPGVDTYNDYPVTAKSLISWLKLKYSSC